MEVTARKIFHKGLSSIIKKCIPIIGGVLSIIAIAKALSYYMADAQLPMKLAIVPLIIPLGHVFQIHPVHLGIIFLVNMELGYLTPPVGLNLFLASYRFEEPMQKIYRSILLFFFIQLVSVLMITYLPLLSTWHL